ncbi:hypothetical protein V498_06031, partial [Pseudogymnoascus sp. VKM F-4517 (FW-2822)]
IGTYIRDYSRVTACWGIRVAMLGTSRQLDAPRNTSATVDTKGFLITPVNRGNPVP